MAPATAAVREVEDTLIKFIVGLLRECFEIRIHQRQTGMSSDFWAFVPLKIDFLAFIRPNGGLSPFISGLIKVSECLESPKLQRTLISSKQVFSIRIPQGGTRSS